MFKNLRIVFTIVCALFLVAIIPAGMLFDWIGVTVCFLGALLFFGLMLLCKQSQEKQEPKTQEPSFLDPKKEENPSDEADGK